ncbi:hypothetical protein SCLCIDRAFT_10315 [Scleroderma citrinum Foug A]|uniref:Uncharacterized protein n=1 Tax=Scleroderma citrinum Foug A TaxID=1036808 RepID=A0A0C2Z7Z1_9AGAM|nr:hypothetical protein SCLCIDRAFT_10315 [Scleroderma citrinum Foug A]
MEGQKKRKGQAESVGNGLQTKKTSSSALKVQTKKAPSSAPKTSQVQTQMKTAQSLAPKAQTKKAPSSAPKASQAQTQTKKTLSSAPKVQTKKAPSSAPKVQMQTKKTSSSALKAQTKKAPSSEPKVQTQTKTAQSSAPKFMMYFLVPFVAVLLISEDHRYTMDAKMHKIMVASSDAGILVHPADDNNTTLDEIMQKIILAFRSGKPEILTHRVDGTEEAAQTLLQLQGQTAKASLIPQLSPTAFRELKYGKKYRACTTTLNTQQQTSTNAKHAT